MAVVSVSMPDELLERLDDFADEHGYTGRSEVVREAARNLLGEFQDQRLEDRELMGIVTVTFDYETTSVEERMMRLRHEHEHLVASNVHSHVGDHYCMELFILEGDLEAISTFVGKVRATRDTLSVDYSVLPVDDIAGAVGGGEGEGESESAEAEGVESGAADEEPRAEEEPKAEGEPRAEEESEAAAEPDGGADAGP